jgi:hypothetical protein
MDRCYREVGHRRWHRRLDVVFRCYSGTVEGEEDVDKRDQECERDYTEDL